MSDNLLTHSLKYKQKAYTMFNAVSMRKYPQTVAAWPQSERTDSVN